MKCLTRRATLAATAALTFAGIASGQAATPTYAVVTVNQQALFFNQLNQGASDAAKKVGANLVVFDANNDPTAQNNAIETYTNQKVNGIIVVAIDVNGIMPAVNAAAAAGIPVVAVDSILPKGGQKAQIGVDNPKAGELIGKFFADKVKTEMGGKATVGIVGALNSFIQNQRLDGFKKGIAGAPGITLGQTVDGRNIQDNAMAVSETLITGSPDLTAIYATGEPALVGALAAIDSGNHKDKIKVVGWDLTAQAIKGIDEGWVLGIVQQDPSAEGAAAVDALVKLNKGEPVETPISIPVTIVTKANVEPYRAIFK